jgi:serine/threonine protein phosphatase PrpC
MTRSVGDFLGKEIGIISTPIVTHLDNHFEDNYFVVLASDGVWDVMDNDEVVNFVEQYRHYAQRVTGDLEEQATLDKIYATSLCMA